MNRYLACTWVKNSRQFSTALRMLIIRTSALFRTSSNTPFVDIRQKKGQTKDDYRQCRVVDCLAVELVFSFPS